MQHLPSARGILRRVTAAVRRAGVGFVLAGLLVPAAGAAQHVATIDRVRSEVGVRIGSSWVPQSSLFTSYEWLRLHLDGSVVDRDMIRYRLGLRPSLAQNRLSRGDEAGTSNTRLLGVDLDLQFLPTRPLSGYLRLIQQYNHEGAYGESRADVSGRLNQVDAGLRFENVLMPLDLTFQRQRSRSWWEANGQQVESNLAFETFRLLGVNRKTTLQVEQTTNHEPVDSRVRRATLENRQTWGKGSRLRTRISYQHRTTVGFADYRIWQWGFDSRLQHTRSIWSDWSYQEWDGRTNGVQTGRRVVSAVLNGSPIRQATARVLVRSEAFRSGDLRERRLRIEPGLSGNVRLPGGAALTASASLGYEDYRLTGSGGVLVSVVNESHVVDQTGAFQLDNAGADATTVVVRGPNAVIFQEGLDYEVFETGGFVEVVALPGGRVIPGQEVTVDYRFRPPEGFSAPALVGAASATLRFRFLRVYYRRWLHDPKGEEFDNGVRLGRLRFRDNQTFGIDATLSLRRISAALQARRGLRVDDGYRIENSSIGGKLTARLPARMTAKTGVTYYYAEGTGGSNRRLTGHAGVDWRAAPDLFVGATVAVWRSTQFETSRRTQLASSLQFSWTPGLLRFSARYYLRDWTTDILTDGESESSSHRLYVELARRF